MKKGNLEVILDFIKENFWFIFFFLVFFRPWTWIDEPLVTVELEVQSEEVRNEPVESRKVEKVKETKEEKWESQEGDWDY